MNDIFVLLESVSVSGRIALGALVLVAAGLLVFDRRARVPRLTIVRRSRDDEAAA
jgi:hypothetical protein